MNNNKNLAIGFNVLIGFACFVLYVQLKDVRVFRAQYVFTGCLLLLMGVLGTYFMSKKVYIITPIVLIITDLFLIWRLFKGLDYFNYLGGVFKYLFTEVFFIYQTLPFYIFIFVLSMTYFVLKMSLLKGKSLRDLMKK